MRNPNANLYQGRDWSSTRWTVADAFDTLERIHDLSLCQGWAEDSDPDETTTSLIPELLGLCEDLRGQLSFVYADTIPADCRMGCLQARWVEFEVDAYLDELVGSVIDLSTHGTSKGFGAIVLAASVIKERLKRLDL